MRVPIIAALGLTLAASGGQAANFTPPQGCRLEVTVQNRGCSVVQYYRCDADPAGHQRSAVFGKDGLRHLSRIDAETRWVESSDPNTGLADFLVERSKDHASFQTLLDSGTDDFDFWTESNTGERLRHVGQDVLTGDTVVIDGQELEVTRFRLKTYDAAGELLIERSGQQFVSRKTGRFYGGIETQSDWTGARQETNDSPVTFAFPGESGFGDTEPQFDCDQLLTQLLHERA
ncbi:hypothetical protein EYF88_07515 [Paracoccus sediminis]|uniref:Uncharacterized protein n=1 Tax=Paracoccus sediminis TaxID=1214787 RepID=A0A238W7C2_9RHOB|nr:hypothetical protein [Paracoccus sediminis]TBN51622.1 hypothetical protein EYF88_07515 [Paracoccus sediminis]SNR42184.1 hypothetical protein SAMN06265378_103414 [Paracoccus sediminis]